MSLEAIKLVSEAEQYAQDLRTDTQAQIKKIKSDSERSGRETLESSLNGAFEETKRLMSEAEQKADQHAGKILEQSHQECDALKARASVKLDKAVEFIVERIVID